LLLPAALAFLLSCAAETKRPAGGQMPAVSVSFGTAVLQDVPVILKAIGSVEASNSVAVRARIGGELTRVAFQEGQEVRKGDLLFSIDARPFENALASALADSARDAAKAAGSETDLKRYADLLPKEYVSQQQFDAARSEAEALRAAVVADAAAVRNARLNLSFCSIRAPISGRTGKLTVREGNLISANGEPLVTIQQLRPVFASFSVPEQKLAEIRRNMDAGRLRAEASASEDSAAVHVGELSFVDNQVDESTGMIDLKAVFSNEDEALWPGQFIDVRLFLTTLKGAVVVPAPAVQRGQQGDFVYVIGADQTVSLHPVTIAQRLDDIVALSGGVAAGDRVVTDGQLRLVPGARVDLGGGAPKSAASAPASGAGGK
jgi:membrane fusion protein, multidrug efflux system